MKAPSDEIYGKSVSHFGYNEINIHTYIHTNQYKELVDYNSVAIFICLAVVASQICEIPRNSLKIRTYTVQGHPRSSILVPIESAYATFY